MALVNHLNLLGQLPRSMRHTPALRAERFEHGGQIGDRGVDFGPHIGMPSTPGAWTKLQGAALVIPPGAKPVIPSQPQRRIADRGGLVFLRYEHIPRDPKEPKTDPKAPDPLPLEMEMVSRPSGWVSAPGNACFSTPSRSLSAAR